MSEEQTIACIARMKLVYKYLPELNQDMPEPEELRGEEYDHHPDENPLIESE